MTTVRSVVHPGWIEVTGPGLHAVVAAADRHAEPLTDAAREGLAGLLEALTAHGLGGAPDLAAVVVSEDGVRVLVRGAGSVVLGDGTRIGSEGRQPWRDLDVEPSAAGDEVVVAAPEPENPRGWRRPARLGRPAAAVVDVQPTVQDTPAAEVPEVEPAGEAEDVAPDPADVVSDASPEDDPVTTDEAPDESGRTDRDLLVGTGTGEDESGRTGRDLSVGSGTDADVRDAGLDEDDRDGQDEQRATEDLLGDDADSGGADGTEESVDAAVEEDRSVVDGESDEEDRTAADEASDEEDRTAADEASQPDLTLPPPDEASAGLPPAARVPVSTPPKGGLIDSVPWRRGGAAAAVSNPPTAELPVHTPPPPPPPPPTGSTGPRVDARPDDAHAAADHPADDPRPPRPQDTARDLPDHEAEVVDEHPVVDVTTDRGSLHRSDDDLDRPVVLAVLCPAGHPSPPHAGACRTCGREIPPQQPFQTPRPALGVLRISTGGVVPLDRGVLLGRAPRVNEELPANQRPHLLKVGGVDRDISRNHAEVVLEGWHVLVRDLGSTNGTTVTLPGEEAVRLRPTEDQGIEPGTVITLADEVSLTYEVDG